MPEGVTLLCTLGPQDNPSPLFQTMSTASDVIQNSEISEKQEDLPEDLSLLSPEVLFGRYREGDSAAFTELVAQMGDRLFAFIARFLGNRTEAEDVYQNVWIKVATRAELYDPQARWETWLYTIARHACLDALRARSRRREVSWEEGEEEASRPTPDDPPEKKLEEEELGLRIANAVEALPLEQREVFLLKEEGNLTFEEIGDLLGCGKETAKSRMRYALARLRNALGPDARAYQLTLGNPS